MAARALEFRTGILEHRPDRSRRQDLDLGRIGGRNLRESGEWRKADYQGNEWSHGGAPSVELQMIPAGLRYSVASAESLAHHMASPQISTARAVLHQSQCTSPPTSNSRSDNRQDLVLRPDPLGPYSYALLAQLI